MNPKIRPLLERCVMDGIKYGYQRAHKHTNTPDQRTIEESIESAIWNELDEFFDWQAGVQ